MHFLAQSNEQRISFREYQEYQHFLAENPNFNGGANLSRVAAPVTQVDQGARVQAAPLVAPPFYQPFLGMHTLAPSASNLATSHTNQERASAATSSVNCDRVHHASATLPRRATSALVNRRARGPAQPSPVLPYRRDTRIATIMQCLRAADVDGLVDFLCAALDEAGSRFGGRGDYTQLLAPERMFALTADAAIGEGVEREVFHTAVQRFITDSTAWFQQGEGDQLTLLTFMETSETAD
ncbi:hypothetical protein C8J57DRAFT_1610575 [Mycena rebaudengoi]|nr:hypothetical protein C8J57DRAFT_1610575 [Mycena rebaudengoi]